MTSNSSAPFETVETVEELIRGLDTDDLPQQREASRKLIALGARTVPPLIEALRTGTPDVRKSSVYLLGALKTTEALEVLTEALNDEEPKVRQNAAVALGKLGEGDAVPALAEASERETVGWVRASMFLSLGALGGDLARQALARAEPGEDSREQEAHRKALDRVSTVERCVGWNPEGIGGLSLLVEAPEGLEFVAQDEATSHGIRLESLRPGMLACADSPSPDDLLPHLRCIYGILTAAGEGPVLSPEDPAPFIESLPQCLTDNPVLRSWKEWLSSEDEGIRYRFSVQGVRLRKDRLRLLIGEVRRAMRPLEWTDSPSHYDVELILQADADASRFYVRPSFIKDRRFDYRLQDVGASIQPVVGACLARLSRGKGKGGGRVFDPVCGSGTLLIERAMLDGETTLAGLDVSPTAVRAAHANFDRAGLAGRIAVKKGDATDPKNWPECVEALANLPFGMRTKHEASSLPALYEAVAKNLSERLQPGGRAVLYTTASAMLRSALDSHRGKLKVERQLRVRSGGMNVHVFVLTSRRK